MLLNNLYICLSIPYLIDAELVIMSNFSICHNLCNVEAYVLAGWMNKLETEVEVASLVW